MRLTIDTNRDTRCDECGVTDRPKVLIEMTHSHADFILCELHFKLLNTRTHDLLQTEKVLHNPYNPEHHT